MNHSQRVREKEGRGVRKREKRSGKLGSHIAKNLAVYFRMTLRRSETSCKT